MYKLLLATDQADVRNIFSSITDWGSMGYSSVDIVPSAQAAVEYLERSKPDAVGYALNKIETNRLHRYLLKSHPNLPIFQTQSSGEAQKQALAEIRKTLDYMHSDITDDGYNDEDMINILRDELTHGLLVGEVSDELTMRKQLLLCCSFVSPDKPFVLFDVDLPQGEVYLTELWHYGSERLEAALRNNFFGRCVDNIYYAVAVLTPRRIRIAACQRIDVDDEDLNLFCQRAEQHVQETVADIKQYLSLDMQIVQVMVLEKLAVLTRENQ
jgi:hypothetical protein